MARSVVTLPYTKVVKHKEEEGPDRDNLPQNPLSPESSVYPPVQDGSSLHGDHGPLFSLGTNWLGPIGASGGESPYVPPDTMGDVSPTQVFVTVNGRFKVYDRNGVVGPLNTDPNTFFASVRSASMSDPRVRFDRLSQRWIVAMIDVANSNNRICLAVSNTATITSATSFTFFFFNYAIGGGNTSLFFDYPTIGIDSKAIYIGGNVFGAGFAGCDVFVVNKANLLSNTVTVTPFRQVCTNAGAGVYTPHGCDNDDPASNEGYVFGTDGQFYGNVKVRKIADPGGTPSMSSDFNITVPSTYNGRSVTALGSTAPLDGLDDRIFAAKIFWNRLTNTPSLWAAHNIRGTSGGVASSTGDRNLSRWYEIRNFTGGGTPTLFQAGTVFSNNASTHSYWIPSIAMNGQGNALLGCSYAGTTVTPNVAVTDRLAGDAPGFMTAPVQITSSAATYNVQGGTQRWGDYSHTAVDPADGMSVWTFQEYCSATNQWGIRVAKMLSAAPTITSASPNSASPNTTLDVTVAGTGFFDPGPTFPNRLAASVSGAGVTVNTVTFNNPTQATVNLTIAPGAAGGARTLTLTNPDGQSASTTFTVNASNVIPPASFSIFRGILITGGLASLATIDQSYLQVQYGLVLFLGEAPVQVILNATSPVSTVSDLKFDLVAHSDVAVTQKIELFDWIANAYEQVDSRIATQSDSTVEVTATTPNRFIQAGTNALRARVSYRVTGPIAHIPWYGFLDQTIWKYTP